MGNKKHKKGNDSAIKSGGGGKGLLLEKSFGSFLYMYIFFKVPTAIKRERGKPQNNFFLKPIVLYRVKLSKCLWNSVSQIKPAFNCGIIKEWIRSLWIKSKCSEICFDFHLKVCHIWIIKIFIHIIQLSVVNITYSR